MAGKDKKITVVFQPHLYSRTKLLFSDFATAFKDADEVILTDIYAAREADDGTINSTMLAEAITKNGTPARHFSDFNEIENLLREEIKTVGHAGDLVITMGAGEAYKIGEGLLQSIKN
ncbi:MAG: UDP-N-acetylmuramate--L-alanine ligase, partial [Candidatus Vogelbacteria bacterium]|nr:UDP-N-acetylmuramate--L-alanine ligase [Candidatus Vogelbacteria bacterium]